MIVGVTGKYCAGKDTVADVLIDRGFAHISLSDILREILKEEGKEPTRENLIALGNELREKKGSGYLARLALKKIEGHKNYVVTSIRNPTEVEVLKTSPNFTLLGVDAPAEIRFERLKSRGRKEDGSIADLEGFLKQEQGEENIDPSKQQLTATFRMADRIVINDKGLEELKSSLDEIVAGMKKERLDWDGYFMELSRAVGLRGTCDRGKSGALIVKNKRVISTGYVGAPAGLPHCDEVGHHISGIMNPDGSITKHCIRTAHAEQNAIVQAARHGTSIEGGTIYCKMEPCHVCAKMIINAGIKKVVAEKKYHGADLAREMLNQAGVELVVINNDLEKYTNM